MYIDMLSKMHNISNKTAMLCPDNKIIPTSVGSLFIAKSESDLIYMEYNRSEGQFRPGTFYPFLSKNMYEYTILVKSEFIKEVDYSHIYNSIRILTLDSDVIKIASLWYSEFLNTILKEYIWTNIIGSYDVLCNSNKCVTLVNRDNFEAIIVSNSGFALKCDLRNIGSISHILTVDYGYKQYNDSMAIGENQEVYEVIALDICWIGDRENYGVHNSLFDITILVDKHTGKFDYVVRNKYGLRIITIIDLRDKLVTKTIHDELRDIKLSALDCVLD